MSESSKQDGVIQALVERFEKIRLPVALQLKEKVDRGEVLNDMDITFLEEVLSDSRRIKPLVDAYPEWQGIAARMAHTVPGDHRKGAGERTAVRVTQAVGNVALRSCA